MERKRERRATEKKDKEAEGDGGGMTLERRGMRSEQVSGTGRYGGAVKGGWDGKDTKEDGNKRDKDVDTRGSTKIIARNTCEKERWEKHFNVQKTCLFTLLLKVLVSKMDIYNTSTSSVTLI